MSISKWSFDRFHCFEVQFPCEEVEFELFEMSHVKHVSLLFIFRGVPFLNSLQLMA